MIFVKLKCIFQFQPLHDQINAVKKSREIKYLIFRNIVVKPIPLLLNTITSGIFSNPWVTEYMIIIFGCV